MTGTNAVDLYYDPFDFDIDDDPYPSLEAAARRRPALLQREVQLLRAESLRGRLPRASELSDLPLGARHDDGRHHERSRGAARRHPVRGSAASRSAPAFAVKGFHPAADGGDRAADASVLRARARSVGRFGPVRLHRGSRRADSDAHDRLSARHPRRDQETIRDSTGQAIGLQGRHVQDRHGGRVREQLPVVRRLHRLARRPPVR